MAEISGGRETRKRLRGRREFAPAENVEVSLCEEGLKGSWHAATVIICTKFSRVIQYSNLLTQDESSKLIETIPVSDSKESQAIRNRKNDCVLVRPLPPDAQIHEISYGLCVDAFVNDAWWEGVVFDHEEGSENRLIFFPDQGDQQIFSVNLLRPTQDWDESSDHWKLRGNWLLLQVLKPFIDGDVLPVSVRDFWNQLSIMASFKEKIGLWMLGSLLIWDSLVTGLIQELLSVVHGLSNFCYDKSVNATMTLGILRGDKAKLEDRRSRTSPSSWQKINIKGEFCPEAIDLYVSGSANLATQNIQVEIVEKVKKHLLAVGWKIEAKTRDNGSPRFRFLSPEGKQYLTLRKACIDVSKRELEGQSRNSTRSYRRFSTFTSNNANIHPEPAFLMQNLPPCSSIRSSEGNTDARIPKERNGFFSKMFDDSYDLLDSGLTELRSYEYSEGEHQSNSTVYGKVNSQLNVGESSQIYMNMQSEYHPEAILTFMSHIESSREKGNEKISAKDKELMELNVQKHLLYMGWRISERRSKLRFISPDGVAFHSLYTACEAYLDKEEDLENAFRCSLKDSNCIQYSCSSNHHPSSSSKLKKQYSEVVSSEDEAPGSIGLKPKPHSGESTYEVLVASPTEVEEKTLSILIDNGIILSKQKVRYICERDDHVLLEGYINRNGIRCKCCRKLHTVSGFEAHAGHVESRPGSKTFLLDGRSLLRCQLQLLYGKDPINFLHPRMKQQLNLSQSDSICSVCHQDGTLILCDHCPSAFHVACVGLMRHNYAWYGCCKYSLGEYESRPIRVMNFSCRERQGSGAQRTKLKEKIFECLDYAGNKIRRAITEPYSGSKQWSMGASATIAIDVPEGEWFCHCCRCGICGCSEFNPAENFTENTMLYCDQCECEYHVGCLKTKGMILRSCPTGNWFCTERCSKIFIHLHNILGEPNETANEGLSWTILRSKKEMDDDLKKHDCATVARHRSKLDDALKIFHECFMTMIEPRTRSDLLSDLIMNKESELNRLNFWGFYIMILEKGNEIISVATVRVYGEKVAEMPLIGTSAKYRRQGMCHILLDELEKLLSSLGVERLCIPAIPSLLETWTGSFGFTKMKNSERLDLLDYNLLSFPDTIMCQKFLRATPAV